MRIMTIQPHPRKKRQDSTTNPYLLHRYSLHKLVKELDVMNERSAKPTKGAANWERRRSPKKTPNRKLTKKNENSWKLTLTPLSCIDRWSQRLDCPMCTTKPFQNVTDMDTQMTAIKTNDLNASSTCNGHPSPPWRKNDLLRQKQDFKICSLWAKDRAHMCS